MPRPGTVVGPLIGIPGTPAVSANLACWLRSTQGIGFSGSNVATWGDAAGIVSPFTAGGVAANMPTFVPAGVNSLPSLRFDGVANLFNSAVGLTLANFVTVSAYTSFAVVKVTSIATNNAASYNNDSIWNAPSANSHCGMNLKSAGPVALVTNWTGGADTSSTCAIATGSWMVLQCGHDTGQIYISANGAGAVNVASGNTQSTTGVVSIGGYTGGPGGTKYLTGEIAELYWYKRALSGAETLVQRQYLYSRYAIVGV